jgi:TonB family protein
MFTALLIVKITVLLAAAWVATRAIHSQSADLRHRVWACALAGSLVLPVLGVALPGWRSATVARALAQATAPIAPAPILNSLPPMVVTASAARLSPVDLLLYIWIAGCSIMLLQLIRGLTALASISTRALPILDDRWLSAVRAISLRLEIRRPVRLLESSQPQAMPITWGFLRPAILIPPGARHWDDARRHLVLAHELAHIARFDWPVQILAELARCFYWFHPLAWFAATRLRQESERATDDAVLNSGVRPNDYATQLLDLARTLKNADRVWSTALAMARTSNLERRFIAMLNPSINRRRTSRRTALFTATAALALLLPLAALKAPAQGSTSKFSGTVLDPRNAGIPNATVILTNPQTQAKSMTTSDASGKYALTGIPAGEYEVSVLKPGFAAHNGKLFFAAGQDSSLDVALLLGAVNERINVTGEPSEPFIANNHASPARLNIGGDVQAAHLEKQVRPAYPLAAKQARIQGSVLLHALIGEDGALKALSVLNSDIDTDLAKAAVEAVSQWVYRPTLLNGQPVEVVTNITVNFTLMP